MTVQPQPILYAGWTVRCKNCGRTSDGGVIDCPDQRAGKCHQYIDPHPPVTYDPAKHGVGQP